MKWFQFMFATWLVLLLSLLLLDKVCGRPLHLLHLIALLWVVVWLSLAWWCWVVSFLLISLFHLRFFNLFFFFFFWIWGWNGEARALVLLLVYQLSSFVWLCLKWDYILYFCSLKSNWLICPKREKWKKDIQSLLVSGIYTFKVSSFPPHHASTITTNSIWFTDWFSFKSWC